MFHSWVFLKNISIERPCDSPEHTIEIGDERERDKGQAARSWFLSVQKTNSSPTSDAILSLAWENKGTEWGQSLQEWEKHSPTGVWRSVEVSNV